VNLPLISQNHWCHVIDTVIQLYMILGLRIKLKSMSVSSWRWCWVRLGSSTWNVLWSWNDNERRLRL